MTGPTLPGECIASIRLISSPAPSTVALPMFSEDQPYIESDPSTVRDDFLARIARLPRPCISSIGSLASRRYFGRLYG
jgi:hypothetical protein